MNSITITIMEKRESRSQMTLATQIPMAKNEKEIKRKLLYETRSKFHNNQKHAQLSRGIKRFDKVSYR